MFGDLFHKKSTKLPYLNRTKLTFGQKMADRVTKFCGTWTFIIALFIFIGLWMAVNIYFIFRWDPYPFILLNFVLSCLAAVQAPIILMSQSREEYRDRLRARYDYEVNKKAEKEIREIQSQLKDIKKILNKIKT